jgi:segregation and condensation protein B
MEIIQLKRIIEAAIITAEQPVSPETLLQLFSEEENISLPEIRKIIEELVKDYQGRGFELKEIASGYRFQVQTDVTSRLYRLLEEKPTRYSRALLETLSLIAYRQPITRAEIEEVRGVSVSTTILKTLTEREWVKIVGHRDVPGKPALYATTKAFLDYFNLKSIGELPTLLELKDLEDLDVTLQVQLNMAEVNSPTNAIPLTAVEDEIV